MRVLVILGIISYFVFNRKKEKTMHTSLAEHALNFYTYWKGLPSGERSINPLGNLYTQASTVDLEGTTAYMFSDGSKLVFEPNKPVRVA